MSPPAPDPNPAALRLAGVSKRFGDLVVLDDVTLDLSAREVTFLVGRSGEGKSVFCRLAVGLLRPDRGAISLFGARMDALPERALRAVRRHAPYVVQGPALLDWLSVEQNVRLACKGRPERAREVLARAGISHLAEAFPPTLGPGTRKRVAIARALALEPRWLIFDEPTTGLDPRAAEEVNALLRKLRDEGLGALVVSHDYDSLRRVADRVIVLSSGKVAFDLAPEAFSTSDAQLLRRLRGDA